MANFFQELETKQQQGEEQPQAVNFFAQQENQLQQQEQSPPQQKEESWFAKGIKEVGEVMGAFATAAERVPGRLVEGATQLGLKGAEALGADTSQAQQNLAQYNQQKEAESAEAFRQHPIASTAGVLTTGATEGILSGGVAGVGKSFGQQALANAGTQAAIGLGEYGDVDSRMNRAAMGGILGGGIPLAAKGYSEAAKNITKSSGLFARPAQEAADIINRGGTVTAGQALGRPGLQATEKALADVPLVGTAGNVNKAINTLHKNVDEGLGALGVGQASKTELGQELVGSVKSAYKAASAKTDAAYKAALDSADTVGTNIPLAQTQQVAKQAKDSIQALSKEGLESLGPSKEITSMLDDLASKDTINPKHFETLRKSLAGKIQDLKKGSGSDMLPVFQDMKKAMDLDLDSFGTNVGGELANKLQSAREIFKVEKLPFKTNPVLKRVIQNEGLDSDQLVNMVTQGDKPELTKTLLKNLTPEGRDVFKKTIFTKIAEKATVVGPDGDEALNLIKLSREFGKMKGTISALPDADQNTIKGIQKLILGSEQLLKPSRIPTATAQLGSAGLGAYLASTGAALTAAPVIKMVNSLLTNPAAVKQLVKLGGGKLTSRASGLLMQSLKEMAIPSRAAPRAAVSSETGRDEERRGYLQ